ncbi:hypothetical protein P691DRAFT_779000 [Macrolepiota fuliginosa MF-IS2]|uniref:Phosphatidylserine decarboxylase proenzyme 2 n=1 Tax=Macrolepiota fuliginosa MF-IS2 TaxID=1400762 RepID=A0A9P5X2N3_9AGAR|nr:hypothetical protein P691DRAFT_779000 [Macrolepiota fuliginosa MF-IS2]
MSTKFKRALKHAARLPVKAARGSRGFSPAQGELPVIVLRILIVGCTDLVAKDRNGYSDPFVVVSVLNSRQQTPVAKRTINPTYNPKDATFDFPLYLSTADKLGALELVVWDKDVLSKDYLGEAALPLEDWFADRPFSFNDPANTPFPVYLVSTRSNTTATGAISLKLGFLTPPNSQSAQSFADVFKELNKRSRPSLVSAPPTEGVGTVRSHQAGPAFHDDGGLSSDEDDDDDDEFTDAPSEPSSSAPPSPLIDLYTAPAPPPTAIEPPKLETITAVSPTTPTHESTIRTPVAAPAPKTGFIPRMKFPRSLSGLTASRSSSSTSTSDNHLSPPVTTLEFAKKAISRKGTPESPATIDLSLPPSAKKRGTEYKFAGGNDILGIVMLEVQGAEDLPRLRNMTRTGWDMDPFVVISFGKKVFRTRVIRHSRNPVWDEKLLFHVRRYESSFNVQLTILDWDKLSSNDLIGDVSFNIKELLDSAPQPGPNGLYPLSENEDHPMKEFKMPLAVAKDISWEAKNNPMISFRAKYQPYDALRQRFWLQYMKQYDADGTYALSHIELTSMLDSLGSTLSSSTISKFFTRFGKKAHEDELSFEEATLCLEEELNRPEDQKRRLDAEDTGVDSSVSATPVLQISDRTGNVLELDQLDFSGPQTLHDGHADDADASSNKVPAPPGTKTEPMQMPLHHVTPAPVSPLIGGVISASPAESSSDDAEDSGSGSGSASAGVSGGIASLNPPPPQSKKGRFKRKGKAVKEKVVKKATALSDISSFSASSGGEDNKDRDDSVERVINVKSCPLCHRPRMNGKAEMDIMTHIAVCASQDWNRVDRIVVGNFVTASQAQRKWYTKVISKLSSGNYKLGANSANIIVQNRLTGQLEEEKMQVYVRLGIRLLYKGMNGRMEGARARKLLKSLSIKQGIKYDSAESAKDIPGFIEFHNLNVNEILDPIDSFKNFNQFFYRKLKPSARPVEALEDPYRLVSAADCRLMTFDTVHTATTIWIKGREFSVERLLGNTYKHEAPKYDGGALAIFRLAPQDYHRFHSPVDGKIGKMTYIAGEYYTVNPQAIRTALDVYGENARKIVPIDSPQFGRVMAVCVGAMMVGSILTTVEEGQEVKRGQEFGYFAFGGSTIVLLFEKGAVQWDEDLLINGRASLETLVRVGMGIGMGTRRPN